MTITINSNAPSAYQTPRHNNSNTLIQHNAKSNKLLSRVVTSGIGKLITGDLIIIDTNVIPKIGDIALCGVLNRAEHLERYQGQDNVIGKVTFKWQEE
jgi:hypothetical protein